MFTMLGNALVLLCLFAACAAQGNSSSPGVYGEWEAWSACSGTIGAGQRMRNRTCSGTTCTGAEMEVEDCYIRPENVVCFAVEKTFIKEPTDVTLSCQTTRVWPEHECSFYKITDGRRPTPIEGKLSYRKTLSSTDTSYSGKCDLKVPISYLGEGSHTFALNIYANNTGGRQDPVSITPNVKVFLQLPQASSVCPDDLLEDYLCGRPVTCNCTLSKSGRPLGKAMWFKDSLPVYGPLVISMKEMAQEYACVANSDLGSKTWSTLNLATETTCLQDPNASKLG